jgi:Cof subfamily protein (haloacid dehalogenase superfamily)
MLNGSAKGATKEQMTDPFKSVKLIASDLDGTLVPYSRIISPYTCSVFERLEERGIVFAIATGRALSTIDHAYKQLPGLKYIIASNGAKAYEAKPERLIYSNFMSPKGVSDVWEELEHPDISVEVFVDGEPFVSDNVYEKRGGSLNLSDEYRDYFLTTRKPVDDIFGFIKKHINEIENINFIFTDDDLRTETFKKLADKKAMRNSFSLTSSFTFNLEVGGTIVSKASALEKIASCENLKPQNIIGFGDNINDIEMLRFCGVSGVVADSVASREFEADYVIKRPEEDGVAHFLEEKML